MNVFGVYIYEGHSNACLYNINKMHLTNSPKCGTLEVR